MSVVMQSDGTTLHVKQMGDEYFHFYLTSDNLFITRDSLDRWYYVKYKDGEFTSTQMLAHDNVNRYTEEVSFVNDNLEWLDLYRQKNIFLEWRDRHEQEKLRRVSRHAKVLKRGTYYGKRKGLVILVNFTNKKMKSSTAHADYLRMFNEAGYSENNHVGCVSDYFKDQSYGKFQLEFHVVGPISLPNTYGYYGTNGLLGKNNIDKKAYEMIHDACILADEGVDFADYDWDNDGEVDQVFIVYAGYGEATGGPTNTVWPHESELRYFYDEPLILDGVVINRYACSNELYSYTDSYMGIGTACHEFSHCIGLPDLYDTDYTGAFGMSYWGVMDSGSYNGPLGIGEVPCGYTAFEKWYAGWLDFVDVSSSLRIDKLKDLEMEPIAYRIQNEGNTNEFYTIEYRQGVKWFSFVKNFANPHGLLITHIDYDSNAWKRNRVNPSPSHQRMSPIPADNQYGENYSELMGDLYPGVKNVVVMNDVSHSETGGQLFSPNHDGTYEMGITVNQIAENEDGTASFNIIFNKELFAPRNIIVSDLFTTGFGISWEPVAMADSYSVELSWLQSKKPYVRKVEEINNITGTIFYFENLQDNTYTYRVRSNRDKLSTEWSDYESFDFKIQDAVDVVHNLPASDNEFLHNLGGYRTYDNYRHGVYIVKRNGKIFKVLK